MVAQTTPLSRSLAAFWRDPWDRSALAACALFFAYFVAFSLWRLFTLQLGLDWTVEANTVFHTAFGAPMENAVRSLWVDHFSPALVVFLPFYRLHPTVGSVAMLAGQAGAVAAAGLMIHRIATLLLGDGRLGFLFALFFLSRPELQMAVIHDFHMLTFSSFFIMLAYLGYFERRAALFWTGFTGALLCREDVFLTLLGIPLLMLWRERAWRRAIVLAAIIGAYELTVFKVVFPAVRQGEDYAFLDKYAWIAGSFGALALEAIRHPAALIGKIVFERDNTGLVRFLTGFLWLPPLSIGGWLTGLPSLSESLLSNDATLAAYNRHYVVPPLLALTTGSILTLAGWKRLTDRSARWAWIPAAVLLLLCTVNLVNSRAGALPHARFARLPAVRLERLKLAHARTVAELLARIPPGVPYAVSANIFGRYHDAGEQIRLFKGQDRVPADVGWLLLDTGSRLVMYGMYSGRSIVHQLLASGRWEAAAAAGGVHLLRATASR